jgi:hypothetical protein
LERKAFEVNAENADSKEKLVFGVQSDQLVLKVYIIYV